MSENPKVGIITRTKDRPLMLKRAMDSVSAQTKRDFVWVIVNDGGEQIHVDEIAEKARLSGIPVIKVHHETSFGRPAAANRGIEACNCEYLLLHDDDDTIEPTFIEETLAFLEKNRDYYDGVAVYSRTIEEVIENDSVKTVNVGRGYEPSSADIITLFTTNPFPPIAFLFSRSGWLAAGKFNEKLAFTEDWQFNQRYMGYRSVGILPSVLANLHVRYNMHDHRNAYANTVVASTKEHESFRRYWINESIQNDISRGMLGFGQLNLYGELFSRLELLARYHRGFALLNTIAEIVHFPYRVLKKLSRLYKKK